jgi:tetratricopeptide (TPR) repeat protein
MRCLRSPYTFLLLLLLGAACSKTPSGGPTLPDFPTDLGQSKTPAWKTHLGRGKEHFAKEQYDEAIAELTKAIQLRGDHPELFVWRNAAYRAKKQYDKAIADCDQAITLQQDNLEAYLHRGYSFADTRAWDKAIADLTKAIDGKIPDPAGAYSVRGQCFQAKGESVNAIGDFSAALTLKPQDLLLLIRRGDAYFSRGDLASAIADYTAALKLDAGLTPVLLARSEALAQNHDYQGALADADEAVKRAEKDPTAYSVRGLAHVGLHEYAKAVSDFTRAIDLEPKNALHYGNRGRCLGSLLRDYDKALNDHNQAIALAPKDAFLYCDRGKTWFAKRDLKAALDDFTTAIELNRQLFVAWLGRAEVLTRLKNVDALRDLDVKETIKLCDEEIRIRPKNEVAYLFRGYARVLQSSYDKPLADFEQALLIDPSSPEICKALAWLQATCPEARFRDGTKAVSNATKACEFTKYKDAEYLDALAASCAEAGQFDDAVRWANQALKHAWPEFRPEVAARLELYRAKKAFRSA